MNLFLQERKERLKKEGKFLTKTQKQQRAQAQAMLDSMKKQGTSCVSIRHGHLKLMLIFCVAGLEIISGECLDMTTGQIHLSWVLCHS